MSTYVPCAGSPLTVPSAADTTQLNSGNLTTAFTTGVFGTMPPVFEWFRATIGTATPGGTFTPAPCGIYVNQRKLVSFTYPVGGTEWDPSQPIPMRSGDELYFFWQLASSSKPVPVVTCYFRYDADVPANRSFVG